LNKEKISVSLSKDVLKWIDQEREKAPYDPSRSAFIEQILRFSLVSAPIVIERCQLHATEYILTYTQEELRIYGKWSQLRDVNLGADLSLFSEKKEKWQRFFQNCL